MGALLEENIVSLQRWPARVIERGPHGISLLLLFVLNYKGREVVFAFS